MINKKTTTNNLKLSENEKSLYEHIINIQKEKMEQCKKSKDSYCNLLHTELIRSDDGIIKEVRILCDKQKESLKDSKIIYNDLTIKKYDLLPNDKAKKILAMICESIDDNNGVYLSGTFGIGKTFLLYSLMEILKNQNNQTTIGYVDMIITFKKLCNNFDKNENYLNDEIINNLKDIDVLLIDNIGDERNNKFILDNYIMELFNYRLLHNKPTIFASKFKLRKELRLIYQDAKNTPVYLTDSFINRIERLTKNELDELTIKEKLYKESKTN